MPVLRYDALGHVFDVESGPDGGLQEHAARLLRGLATTAAGPPARTYELTERSDVSAGSALLTLVGNVNIGAITAATGSLLLHAGGAARADGSVVIVCAASGGGKSTLTARLAQRDRAYLTDETLCLEPASLRVRPFRKPLVLKRGSQPLFPEWAPAWTSPLDDTWLVPPDLLGEPPPPDRVLTPDLVVLPCYDPGAALRCEPVSAGEAAFLLGRESSQLRHVRGGPLTALTRLVRRAPALRVVFSDAGAAADAVIERWDSA